MSLLIIDNISVILIIKYRIKEIKIAWILLNSWCLFIEVNAWIYEFFNIVIFYCKRLVFDFLNSIVLGFEKFVYVEIKFMFFYLKSM